MSPYKHNRGQTITTDVEEVTADRAFLAHVNIPAAQVDASDTDAVIDGAVGPTGAEAVALVVTTFLNQPKYPRNITVTVAATTAGDVAAGNIVVTGKNFADETISETHAVTADTPATFTGVLAFKEVTSVTIPVQDGASVTVDVGWGKVFGIPYLLESSSQVVLKLFNKAADTGTVTADATDIEKNVITLNGSPNGLKDIDLYIFV
jgi:hypothetical protein